MFNIFKKKQVVKELKAMINGEVISVTEVNDEVFSSCMLGNGIAIHPTDGTVVAPVDGEISVVMEGTNHAVGIKVTNGIDILIHIGIDTVGLKGEGFESFVKMGDKIEAGQKLIKFDKNFIESKDLCSDVILIVLDNPELPKMEFKSGLTAAAGDTIVATW